MRSRYSVTPPAFAHVDQAISLLLQALGDCSSNNCGPTVQKRCYTLLKTQRLHGKAAYGLFGLFRGMPLNRRKALTWLDRCPDSPKPPDRNTYYKSCQCTITYVRTIDAYSDSRPRLPYLSNLSRNKLNGPVHAWTEHLQQILATTCEYPRTLALPLASGEITYSVIRISPSCIPLLGSSRSSRGEGSGMKPSSGSPMPLKLFLMTSKSFIIFCIFGSTML